MPIETLDDNLSGFVEGYDSREVLALASKYYSVVLHSTRENIRLTSKRKIIYLDAQGSYRDENNQLHKGDILFRTYDHNDGPYSG